MAESKGNAFTQEQGRQQYQPEARRQASHEIAKSPQGTWDLQRRDSFGNPLNSPFQFMRRMTEEMDRVFDRVFSDVTGARRHAPDMFGDVHSAQQTIWAPRIEAFQSDSRFVVRAELPGLKKEDVNVNVTDQAIILEGQRKTEQEENRDGFYHTERSYGSFYRAIPLPEGTITDSAEARFRDGVLEVTLQAPPSDVRRGRRVEIK
jgi:HSP20 family protein